MYVCIIFLIFLIVTWYQKFVCFYCFPVKVTFSAHLMLFDFATVVLCDPYITNRLLCCAVFCSAQLLQCGTAGYSVYYPYVLFPVHIVWLVCS